MNINSLIEILNSDETELRLYFTRKRGIRYISYSPVIDDPLQIKLKKLIRDYLKDFISIEQVKFSPVGYKEETIETCNIDYINSYMDVIDSFNDCNVNREPIEDEIINELNFYCLVITDNRKGNNDKVMFFRRVTKFKKLSSKGVFGNIKDNKFKEIDTKLLGIDGNIDLVVYDDNVLILNHISLERIFSLAEQYLEKAQTAISFIRKSKRISNFDQFEEDCLNDRRITRTLTKMLTEENKLENCFENFPNVVNVIEIFELEIDIDKSGDIDRIVYDNKEQLMDVIRLVRDSYYRSIINARAGIDDSI
ncbi:Kiwa anti-phage protein KwaB-like domain-containing protein [Clostridium tyrobutyricum]|uniref:Kiwa anti-phage protein KwaB-like domain-containing protein n=1 Tax=Clostridium tyrobutyricum TaxID=1519 RepID=UPI002B208821|nr:Kiwa anti-phage protein KwaB-like domain-containing protein [Clostridium tyrobutyricum]MEA5008246.1 DUF4868 domain-containing protein [Clostridium tyrobutyricum]